MAALFDDSFPTKWRRVATGVVLAWLVLLIPIGLFAWRFMDETKVTFDPPSGSKSEAAQNALLQYFPQMASEVQYGVVVTARNGGPACPASKDPASHAAGCAMSNVAKVYDKLNQAVETYNATTGKWPATLEYCVGGPTGAKTGPPGAVLLPCVAMDQLKDQLLSADNTVALLNIMFRDLDGSSRLNPMHVGFLQDFSETLTKDIIPGINAEFGDMAAVATGMSILADDGLDATVEDMGRTDVIVIPVAFLIFTYYIRSFRLLLLPFVTFAFCVGASFLVVYPIAKYSGLAFLTFVPQFMVSTCLAISLDYNLFIAMRFQENIALGHTMFGNLNVIVRHTCGHTILVSGVLIFAAWAGMAIIPAEAMQTNAIATSMATFMTVLVNCTLTPALLAMFCQFFKVPATLSCLQPCIRRVKACFNKDTTTDGEAQPLTKMPSTLRRKREAQSKDLWYRLAKFVQRWPWAVVIAILAVGAPFYSQAPKTYTNGNTFEFVPRGLASVEAWYTLGKHFPPGQLMPYKVIITDVPINSAKGYAVMNEVVDSMLSDTNLGDKQYAAMPELGGLVVLPPTQLVMACSPPNLNNGTVWDRRVSWDYLYGKAHGLFVDSSDFGLYRLFCQTLYQSLQQNYMSPVSTNATYVDLDTPYQPSGREAAAFMRAFETIQKNIEGKYPGVSVYLQGGNTINRDYAQLISDYILPMVGAVVGLVVVTILLAFRSVVLPVRMAVSIAYTVSVTFGVGYYFFQTSGFYWLFPHLKDRSDDGLTWMIPVTAISITSALGMDYDVFLLTRIYEYRTTHGYDTASSIVKGLTKTGSIITGAGIIMSVAFFGLVISKVDALNEFGVMLCVSVLIDTFVVRSFFGPAIMFMLGEANWWPARLPAGEHGDEDFADEEIEESPASSPRGAVRDEEAY
eukprot:TRINITY_DN18246_c0_g1_i1.p1 TRINITY_DN18246_c0_g1~~TRINITY_DN18246_c0_g1_i1.p1  ORF type:complete len:924 (+),score=222.83 TRINITY_DN18246_c0_g1_i1:45-2774(+)